MADLSRELTGRGFNAPTRFEADVLDCEVAGTVPRDLNGGFYRVGAEWYLPPKFRDDAILNADGYVSAFLFRNGRVDFRGRWVRTERFEKVREAGRQLYGYYRNPYTDDESVRDPKRPNRRTVSNTATLGFDGSLFTLKEDGLPYRIHPETLETLGQHDFGRSWKSETFTAHPKLDPLSGEMVAFGYEATGLASDDLYIATVSPRGRVSHEIRAKVPYVSVIHDMALTHRHALFPFGGYVTSPERLREGRIHWGWDKTVPSMIGVVPREGDARDMRWFKGPERCMMHTYNAYSEGNKVILYAPFYEGNFFPFFPNVDGSPFDGSKARAYIRRITLDLDSRSDTWQEEILWPTPVMDLGKVDPRVLTLNNRYIFTPFHDETKPFDEARAGIPRGRVNNSYGRFDLHTGKMESLFVGDTHSVAEPTFIPRGNGSQEGEGYLIGVVANYAEHRSELVIADAQRLGEGEIARVVLPFRAPGQVHGEWVDASRFRKG
jgi:carotenoid cleavage dioxygenase-like enzyme